MENEYYKLIPNKTKKELNFDFDFEVNCNGKTKELAIFEVCQEFNLFFDCNLAKNSKGLSDYIKHVTILPQYENKKFGDGIIKEKEMELNLLDALRNEQQMLLEKMKKAIDEDNIGTYKNLVLALKEITYLVNNEEEKIKNSKMYIDFGDDYAYIYYNGRIIGMRGERVDGIVLCEITRVTKNNKNVEIYLDTRGIGMLMFDRLVSEGFNNVKSVNAEIVKIN